MSFDLENITNKSTSNIKINDLNIGISIITCTNRLNCMKNIFANYNRQKYKKKELIIILNNDYLKIEKWKEYSLNYENVSIYKLSQKTSLGECLNFAINQTKYNIIAKFDDDDYYGQFYLLESMKPFYYTDAQIIGKATTYIFFENSKIFAIKNPNRENRYVYRVEGSTLLIKKSVFNKISFPSKNLGEDLEFCNKCYRNNIKIFSTNRFNYIYIRNHPNNHTWKIKEEYLLRHCKIIK